MITSRRANSPRVMRVVDRALDLVVPLLFSIPALQPLLVDTLACGYDHIFHLWRAVQIASLWEQGVLYSRWAPAMAHGLGFPLYLFTSPFPPSLVALLHQMGAAWTVSMNAVFALGVVLGGLTMVKLARELFGREAGWVAGIAYVYAPFQAYDIFNRGSLWEAFAWAWPPLVLWGLHRWVRLKDRRALWIGTAAFAAMVMSHHLFAFLFAPLLILWVVLLAIQMREPDAVGRGALFGLLGLGITAFFWLPPMVERAYVQTGRLLGTWVFDYRYNFLPLDHLLALPRRADPNLVNDWPQKSLGLVPAILGLVPIVFWHKLEKPERGFVGSLVFLALFFSALTLAPSQFLWDRVLLLSYVQFPWRYLGPAAFSLSLLIGAGTAAGSTWLREKYDVSADLLPVLGIVVLIFANLGWFFPDHCSPPSEISVDSMIRWEHTTDTLGTTAKGEYLPIWAERLVEAPSLLDDYETSGPVVRLPSTALPEGAVIHASRYDALRARIRLSSPESFTARYLALYYPGWKAFIDGVRVPVVPASGSGLLTFRVPAGTHEIEIAFGETPLRLAADAISAISLAGLVGLTLGLPRGGTFTGWRGPPRHAVVATSVVGLALILLKVGVVDRQPWLWRATRLQEDGSLRGVETPMQINFGDRAMLIGAEGLTGMVPSGTTQEFTMFWSALNPGDGDWHTGLSLEDSDGDAWPTLIRPARWGRTPPPVQAWPANSYARMDKLVGLPAGIPPGIYTPTLSLFDRKTLEPASVIGIDGNPVGPALSLAPIQLAPPDTPPTLHDLGVTPQAELRACGALGLWQVEPDRASLAPGESLHLRWVWEARRQPTHAKWVNVILENDQGTIMQSWEIPPSAAQWPTDQWRRGDRWIGCPALRLPGSLESGQYAIKVQLPSCDPLAEIPLDVQAPERIWTVPETLTSADRVFGSVIRLAGYSIPQQSVTPGSSLEVELAWQALDEIAIPYRVFVHLVDDGGHLVAQSDGEPVDWTRPTPGWAVGEVIIETRTLIVPEGVKDGTYHFRVGMYDESGERLRLADGTDAVLLGEITVP